MKPSGHKRQISYEHKSTKLDLKFEESPPLTSDATLRGFKSLAAEGSASLSSESKNQPNTNLKEMVKSFFCNVSEETEYLNPVKLHHLNSFMSRSSSYRSTESPASSGLSSSFNISLTDFQYKNPNLNGDNVEFYLSENVESDVYNTLARNDKLNVNLDSRDDQGVGPNENNILPDKQNDENPDSHKNNETSGRNPYVDTNLYTNRYTIEH